MTCGNERDKKGASSPLLGRKRAVGRGVCWSFKNGGFSERVSNFSLGFWEIGPSDFDGARREVVLRGEYNAWTPVLRVFDKLREVRVSPYLSFIPILSVFRCFGWFEAVRGRLIGPKTWDRIV